MKRDSVSRDYTTHCIGILRNNVCMEMTNNYFLIGKNIEHYET